MLGLDRRLPRHQCWSGHAHVPRRVTTLNRHQAQTTGHTCGLAAPVTQPCCSYQQHTALQQGETEDEPSCSGRGVEHEHTDSVALLARELGISEEQVAWLAAHKPHLLHRPMARLRKRLHGLAELLGCAVQQAARMTQKQPALLDIEADSIRRRLGRLINGLGNRRRACVTARRLPVLLASDDSLQSMEQHIQQLVTTLGLDSMESVAQVVANEPLLLIMQPEQVQQRMQALGKCLQLTDKQEQLMRICRKHPWLLSMSVSSVSSKLCSLASALRLSPAMALATVLSYPQLLRLSEQLVADKVALLTEVVPRHVLRGMVIKEPSLLTRSSAKVLQSFRATQEAMGASTQTTIDVVARRPSIVTRSPSNPQRNYRALSIWRFKGDEKRQMVEAHPLLLRLAQPEVHLRCRWLRQLMNSNGFYHSTMRRIPPCLVGIIILHLPTAWSRLQYLAESNQEARMELMAAVQATRQSFEARFPDYKRWLHFKTSEMGCSVPWRQGRRRRIDDEFQHLDLSSETLQGTLLDGSGSSHSAQQEVLSEATVLFYGQHPVHKPRRLGHTVPSSSEGSSPAAPTTPGPSSSPPLGSTPSLPSQQGTGNPVACFDPGAHMALHSSHTTTQVLLQPQAHRMQVAEQCADPAARVCVS